MQKLIKKYSVMKYRNGILVVILSVFGMINVGLSQNRVHAKLEQATVYLQGAALTHSVSTSLKSGSQELLIDGISPTIDISSLKVKANGVLISAVEFSTDYITPQTEQQNVKKLQDSLENYQQQLDETNNNIATYTQLLQMLKDGTSNNMQLKDKSVSITEITANMEFYKSKSESYQRSLNKFTKQKKEITESIARITKQINQDRVKNRQKSGLLKLSLSVQTSINTKFSITYYTNNAYWTPCYDINIASTEKPIVLQEKANVRQTTGLDWEKVRLTLSNAKPNRTNNAPILSIWTVDFRNNIPIYRKNMVKQTNSIAKTTSVASNEQEVAYATAADEADYAEPILMDDYINIDEQEVHVNYDINIPYDIPGNGKSQLIDLKSYNITAEYEYYAAPRLSSETYLLATLSDYEKYNLLAGQATVTYNNTYVGKTYIDPNSTDNGMKLTLATEPRIAIKREKRKDYSSTKIIGSNTTVTYSYLITVKNNQNKTAKLSLKEQFPVSKNKEIEVKLIEVSPQATLNQTETGMISWQTTLKPGETQTFIITYSIKYPKDRTISL